MTDAPLTPEAYRAAFPRLYGPLMARHGRPSAIQLAAAAPILAGRDVLLCAPTASGKTEAWLVPIGERHLARTEAPRVLIVSPTRALVNDLYRRLEPRLTPAGIPLGRWTGDHHDGLLAVTILTPEGFDSRLSRAGDALAKVSAVVVDEVHVLDNSARGDQLRVLLARLRARVDAQVIAASATVGDPEGLAARYLRDPVVVRAGTPRKVVGRIERIEAPIRIARCLEEAADAGLRKVLLFCNARKEVEALAELLRGRPPFGDAVFAHHGSLARPARLNAERRFLETPTALCVCTSTLEMGIDIGDVDLVALSGLPPSTASMLQRVGRGGRRSGASNVLAFASSDFEERAFRTLLSAGSRGEWLEGPYAFRPGVLVQQAVSVLHERRSRTVDGAALNRRLPPPLASEWAADRIDRVLAHAAERGWLARAAGAWGIGPKAETAWTRGTLHGNLAERSDVAVVDSLTGEEVGRVLTADGGSIRLAGLGRRAFHTDGRRVVTESNARPGVAQFDPSPKAAVPAAMARALLAGIGVPAPCRAELRTGRTLFHGLGTAGGALLAGCFPKKAVRSAGPLALVFEGEWPSKWPEPAAVTDALGRLHRSIARSLAMGVHHGTLPEEEQVAAVGALSEIGLVEALVAAGMPEIVEAEDPELWGEAGAW